MNLVRSGNQGAFLDIITLIFSANPDKKSFFLCVSFKNFKSKGFFLKGLNIRRNLINTLNFGWF